MRFISEQIKQYEQKLSDGEEKIKEFKLEHPGFNTNKDEEFSSKVAKAEELLSQARLDLTEAEQARNAIQHQVAMEASTDRGAGTEPVTAGPPSELDQRIAALEQKLDAYRVQYTDQFPDVISTKRLLQQLKERKAKESDPGNGNSASGTRYGPVMQQLKISLSEADAKVAAMRARVGNYSERVAGLRSQAKAVPEIEAQFAQLNRDYEVNKANYQKLIASRDAAKLSGDLSATSEMISFRIIDPPTVPARPDGPNRPRLLSLIFAAALALGAGLAFALSQIRPTFVSLAQLREVTGLPVLGSVSMNWTDAERRRQRRGIALFATSIAGILAFYGAGIAFFLVRF
ncbi:MAG: XrtA system polysaccharide chain length determinant [Burkholderiaceae bacterium]